MFEVRFQVECARIVLRRDPPQAWECEKDRQSRECHAVRFLGGSAQRESITAQGSDVELGRDRRLLTFALGSRYIHRA